MTDVEIGTRALKKYYGYMRSLYPNTFKYTEAQFLVMVTKLKGAKFIADGIGGGIREDEMSDSKVDTAMLNLARKGGGKIPSSMMDFFNYLSNEATKVTFVDAAQFVVVESAKDVLTGVQSVGDSLIFTGKILNFLLPAILLIFIFFWLDKKSDGKLGTLAGKAARSFK